MRDEGPKEDLRDRTTRFGVSIVRLFVSLPKSTEAQVLGRQLLRSGTSVGAQYREAKRARSDAEFLSKMQSAHQELEETCYWLELLERCDIIPANVLRPHLCEADELSAILAAIARNMKQRRPT
jgi:four helix bundle protein